jgi:hypothetical protein
MTNLATGAPDSPRQEIGGISRTIRYKGNRMDIGGHRFFSKSDRVMQWWMDLMPPDLSVPEASEASRIRSDECRSRSATRASARGHRAGALPRSRRCAAWARCWATDDEDPVAPGEVGEELEETEVIRDRRGARAGDPDLVMLIRPRAAASTICASSSTTPSS